MLKFIIKVLFFTVVVAALIAPFSFLKPRYVAPIETSRSDVVTQPPTIEAPLHHVKFPDFERINDTKTKKRLFFDFIRPAVVKENQRLRQVRKNIDQIVNQLATGQPLTAAQQSTFDTLIKKYKVNEKATPLKQAYELYNRVDVVPAPLVLVQAANESAWGTSRFAQIGLNFFGIWCYQEGCGMVPRARNEDATHEVEAFSSVDEAVQRYLHNINSHNAYSVFRTIRKQLREQEQPLVPEVLATGLLPYSERGVDYVTELTEMLRHNEQFFVKPEVNTTIAPTVSESPETNLKVEVK